MADMNYRAVYTQWLHDFANDDALVAELSALTDEKQIEDTIKNAELLSV